MACWFFRLMISAAADADRPVGRPTSRHVARCASCRQFQRSCRFIGEALRSQAAALAPDRTHPAYHVLADLSPGRARTRKRFAAAAAVAAGVALAVLTGLLALTPGPTPPQPPVAPPYTPSVALSIPDTWRHLVRSPLAAEMENLTRDTESGIRFLVACLSVTPPANSAPLPLGESAPMTVH